MEGEGETQQDDYGQSDIFQNVHDLAGVEGIIKTQKNEVDKKKVQRKGNKLAVRAENAK